MPEEVKIPTIIIAILLSSQPMQLDMESEHGM